MKNPTYNEDLRGASKVWIAIFLFLPKQNYEFYPSCFTKLITRYFSFPDRIILLSEGAMYDKSRTTWILFLVREEKKRNFFINPAFYFSNLLIDHSSGI